MNYVSRNALSRIKKQAIAQGGREVASNKQAFLHVYVSQTRGGETCKHFLAGKLIKMQRTLFGGNPHVLLFSFLPPLFLRKVGVTVIPPPLPLPFFLSVQPGK